MSPDEFEALKGICHELKRIADSLEALTVSTEPEAPEATPACLHPEESRIDFGTTEGKPDWQCRLCGFRTVS